jgi:spermidine synthase
MQKICRKKPKSDYYTREIPEKMFTFTFLTHPEPARFSRVGGKLPAILQEQIRQIVSLYCAEGWLSEEADNFDLVSRIIAGSHCFIIAADENGAESRKIVIGMGRSISDRVSDAYIQDVAVKSEYRGQGIGGKIIQLLVERLQAEGLNWIGLVAEKGTHHFYRELGFKEMPGAVPMLIKS